MSNRNRSRASVHLGLNLWVAFGVLALIVCIGLGLVLLAGTNLRGGAPPETGQDTHPWPPGEVPRELPRASVGIGSWYAVFFTKPVYPERKPDRVGGVDAALIADIERARKSVDVASFDLRLPSVTEALVRAKARGVTVRVVTDADANDGSPDFQETIEQLQGAGIPLVLDTRGAYMHNKFVIVDDELVWTGSMNLTPNDVYRNDNNMLRFAVPALTENYQTRFERIFARGDAAAPPQDTPHPQITLANGIRIENYFSPHGGAAQAILARLHRAQKSIRVLAFSFTATEQSDMLIRKAQAGLKVQGVFEARNLGGAGADYETLKRAGLDILPDGNCYIMHNKVYIIDGRTVITGSYNFTANAERTNDENLLIIDDPTLAEYYVSTFDSIYERARHPTSCGD